jgi:PEGA domain-containing protein
MSAMIRPVRALVLVLPLLLVGCVERILTVKSDPPGAAVYVDGERAGETPCDVQYTWYGTRTVTLERDGFVSVSRHVELNTPWWQIFPIDFVTDVIIPFTIRDRSEVHFLLEREPGGPVDVDAVRRRAEELREKTKQP